MTLRRQCGGDSDDRPAPAAAEHCITAIQVGAEVRVSACNLDCAVVGAISENIVASAGTPIDPGLGHLSHRRATEICCLCHANYVERDARNDNNIPPNQA